MDNETTHRKKAMARIARILASGIYSGPDPAADMRFLANCFQELANEYETNQTKENTWE